MASGEPSVGRREQRGQGERVGLERRAPRRPARGQHPGDLSRPVVRPMAGALPRVGAADEPDQRIGTDQERTADQEEQAGESEDIDTVDGCAVHVEIQVAALDVNGNAPVERHPHRKARHVVGSCPWSLTSVEAWRPSTSIATCSRVSALNVASTAIRQSAEVNTSANRWGRAETGRGRRAEQRPHQHHNADRRETGQRQQRLTRRKDIPAHRPMLVSRRNPQACLPARAQHPDPDPGPWLPEQNPASGYLGFWTAVGGPWKCAATHSSPL
jgi:hypothetical protein